MFNYGYNEVFGVYDFSSKFSGVSVLLIGILVLLWIPIFSSSRINVGYYRLEVYALLVVLIVSCISIICSTSLLVTVISMELIAFCSYVLVPSKLTLRGAQGGWIYAVYGSLVSIFVMLGTVLILGSSGSLSYDIIGYHTLQIQGSGNLHTSTALFIGLLLVIFGFMFKLSAAPYHSWAPDVYASTPVGILALFAVVVKVSIFISFIRFSIHCLLPVFDYICTPILLCVGCLSALVGSIGGLLQSQIKRLLAYSSISHIGFILVGLALTKAGGLGPAVCYMFVYSLTVLGIFYILSTTYRCVYSRSPLVYISDLSVLGDWYPVRAVFFVILVFSLLGLPPLVGFFVKYSILMLVIESGGLVLAAILIISAAISTFYYLRLIRLTVSSDIRISLNRLFNNLPSNFELFKGATLSGLCYVMRMSRELRSPRSYDEYTARFHLVAAVACALVIIFLTMVMPDPDLPEGASPIIKKFMLEREGYMIVLQYYVATGVRTSLDYPGRSLVGFDREYILIAHERAISSISSLLLTAVVSLVLFTGPIAFFVEPSVYSWLNLYVYCVCM